MPEPDHARPAADRRARRRAAAAWAAVALLAAAGLVAAGLGIAQRTVWLPEDRVSATATTAGAATDPQLLVTAPGVLETRPGPVTATATSADGGPVVLVLGRETDVAAWTQDVPTAVVGGLAAPSSLAVELPTDVPDAEAPADPTGAAGADPATSDLWAQVARGEGSATLELEPPQGRWLLMAASDGSAPAPEELVLTWPQEVVTPTAVPLVVGGAAALLLALVLAVVLARTTRRRRAAAAAPAPPDGAEGAPPAEAAPAAEADRRPAGSSPWAPDHEHDRDRDEETR